MKEVILSLVLDTFGLGMAEFDIVGVLMELMHNVEISIPVVGHTISYYALEAVVGASIVALFSGRYSLKYVLSFLVALCVIGNTMFTLSSSYPMFAIGRLVPDLPHGAFFDVGAIVLSEIIKPGRVTAVIVGMISEMTITNLLGIPLGMYLSQEFNWRYTSLLIAVFNIVVMASAYLRVPDTHDEAKGKLHEQFHLLRSLIPRLIFAATMFGSAGAFAWFSYVKSYMMFTSGFSGTTMTLIMMLVGLRVVLEDTPSDKISGHYSPLRIVTMTDFIIVLALLMLFFFGGVKTTSLILAFVCCVGSFILSAPLQILLLQNAKGGELLGATGGQIVFNLGSAVGAYCDGMILVLGLAYNYVALPAALLSFAAMSLLLSCGRYRRQQAVNSSMLMRPLGQIAVAMCIVCCRMRCERPIRPMGPSVLQAW